MTKRKRKRVIKAVTMTRLVGYFLGAVSGIAVIGSSLSLIYYIFISPNDEFGQKSIRGDELAIIVLILFGTTLVFYYVYHTGFGKSKLEKSKEELEILKIKKEIQGLKS